MQAQVKKERSHKQKIKELVCKIGLQSDASIEKSKECDRFAMELRNLRRELESKSAILQGKEDVEFNKAGI